MQRKKYSSKYKFDRVVETIKRDNVSEIARQYGISVTIVSKWRNRLMELGYKIFETTENQELKRLRRKVADLERMLGKKEVELGLLKNFADFYESQDGK